MGVARQRAEARLRDRVELRARLVLAAQLEVQQRERAAPRRHRRVHGDEAAHGLLELGEAALLPADVVHRLGEHVHRVLGLPALPDRERLLGEPLGLVEVAGELRLRAAEHRRPPLVERPVERGREPRGGGDLDVRAGHVAQLEQVDDGPAGALQLELGIADRLGQIRRSSEATSSRSCTVSGRQSA